MTRTTRTLASITFDCTDALTVARFWSTVLDREVPDTTSDHVQLAGEPTWSFRSRPEPKAAKNGVHLDLGVANVTKAVDRLVALGATAGRLRPARLPMDDAGRPRGRRARRCRRRIDIDITIVRHDRGSFPRSGSLTTRPHTTQRSE